MNKTERSTTPIRPMSVFARRLYFLVQELGLKRAVTEVKISDREAAGRCGMKNQSLLQNSQAELRARGLITVTQGNRGATYELVGGIHD